MTAGLERKRPTGSAERSPRVARELRVVVTVARRELGAYVHSAIAHVVAVLFLAIQGLSFWAVVQVLSDPQRQAPYGAVLKSHFGGTVLSWAVLFAVVAALSMRLVAEERRQGTWEMLLTAPASEGAVITGKWLGAVVFASLIWVPTLAYVGILWVYLPEGSSVDLGPVVAAYAGVFAAQASFLALGTAASAATRSQVVAAVTTFVALLALLVVGQIPDLAPDWIQGRGALAATLAAADVRGHLESFAAGAVPRSGLVLFAGLTATGLAAASALSAAGRRRRADVLWRVGVTVLIALIAALSLALSARSPQTYDVTAARTHSLHPDTEEVLAHLDDPVTATLVRPRAEVFDPVYEQVEGVLTRMERAQPKIERRVFEPATDPERAAAMAEELSIAPADLAEGGAVIFESGARRRAVELLEMASFDYDELGMGEISELRAEAAFSRAIAEVGRPDRPTLCVTSGHGELPITARGEGLDWSELADALDRHAMTARDVGDVSGGVPPECDALVVPGPRAPLGAMAAEAIEDYLGAGGGLLLAARRELGRDSAEFPATGLELVLSRWGVTVRRELALDPRRALGGPGLWSAAAGYGDHPVTAGFEERRVTVWRFPRAVDVAPPEGIEGAALVSTSAAGWATSEASVVADDEPAPDADARDGPVPVAGAISDPETGARIVVFGSAEAMSSAVVGAGARDNRALALSALRWLAGQETELEIGPKTPERVRLIMSDADRQTVFLLSVCGLPLVFAAAGALSWWWRRRRSGAEVTG